jgi:hypothetical protein
VKVYTFCAVRRSIPVIVVVLAALAAAAGHAKEPPTPPSGTWDLNHSRLTYTGPSAPVRSVVMRLVPRRATFTPVCNLSQCTVSTLVTATGGRGFKVRLTAGTNPFYAGSVPLRTGLRCRGRRLSAIVMITARMIQRQQEPGSALLGTTQVSIDNPGGCKLFQGKRRAVRKTWFTGVQAG